MSQLSAAQERIPLHTEPESRDASRAVAREIADLIRAKAAAGAALRAAAWRPAARRSASTTSSCGCTARRKAVARRTSSRSTSTSTIPMQPDELQSYVRFMREHLFDHVDIDAGERARAGRHAADRDRSTSTASGTKQQIAEAGGIDIQLLGIGRTGHIGFNEPGSARDSRTRLITLDRSRASTRPATSSARRTCRAGRSRWASARSSTRGRSILMAFGEHKAPIIAQAGRGRRSSRAIAASFLQEHPNAEVVLDEAAADGADAVSSRRGCWGRSKWDDATIRKAVHLARAQARRSRS